MERSASRDSCLLLTFDIPKGDQVSPFSSVIRLTWRCPFRPSADVCVELYICFRYKLCKMPRNCVMVYSTIILTFFFREMLCKRGLCRHAVSMSRCVCVCVCPCVTFASCVETNKHIFKIFSQQGSHTILDFTHQMA